MEFKNDDACFTVPDRPTVRQQLAYFSACTGVDPDKHLERMWNGAKTLIRDWDCKLFKIDVDLETVDDPKVADIILWAAISVKAHMNKLSEIPKN